MDLSSFLVAGKRNPSIGASADEFDELEVVNVHFGVRERQVL
jgi:hypothetical protein